MPATTASRAADLAAILDYRDWALESEIAEQTGMTPNEIVRAANELNLAGVRVLNRDDLWRLHEDAWFAAKDFASGLH
jgi:hypothetical protein